MEGATASPGRLVSVAVEDSEGARFEKVEGDGEEDAFAPGGVEIGCFALDARMASPPPLSSLSPGLALVSLVRDFTSFDTGFGGGQCDLSSDFDNS